MNLDKLTQSPVSGCAFEIDIDGIPLRMGVDEVTGLGAGSIGVIRHRRSGSLDGHQDVYPGLVSTPTITLKGLYLYDLADVKVLINWHHQCAGEYVAGENVITRRVVRITPKLRDWHGNLIESDKPMGMYILTDCLVSDLTISDFAASTADPSTWTLSITPKRLDIVMGGGLV